MVQRSLGYGITRAHTTTCPNCRSKSSWCQGCSSWEQRATAQDDRWRGTKPNWKTQKPQFLLKQWRLSKFNTLLIRNAYWELVWSREVKQHKVWILDQLLHTLRKSSDGCAIDNSVIGWNAEVNDVCWHELISFSRVSVLRILCNFMRLSDGYDCRLWPQNGRDEISSTDVANAGHTKRSICKVFSKQLVRISLHPNCLKISIQL